MPSDEKPAGRTLFPSPYNNHRALVRLTLIKLHENVGWPLRLFPLKIPLDAEVETTLGYIIFTWPEHDNTDIIDSLRDQVQMLKETEGALWNPRGKFLVVVADSDGVSPREMGQQIYAEMWKENFIIETTILIAVHDNYITINDTVGLKKDALDLYTGFPYEHGRCGDVTDVTLLDHWSLRNGTFTNNAKLFPLKTPDHFHGCQITVATFGVPPYIILTGNSTDSEGDVVYKLGGLAVQNLLLAVDKMNVTAVFLEPSPKLSVEGGIYTTINLVGRGSDVAIGILPLLPGFPSPSIQPTVPYEYTAFKWFVPCPQPVARMEKIMNTYQIPVWLTMATVFFLTVILWWGLANWRHSSEKDSPTSRTLSHCIYNAGAVSMGVPATNIPNTWKFRFLFIAYVCYCFAMSTVFQAFFTSFLVEPGYGKRFETFDDLLHSSVAYGYNEIVEFGMVTTSYDEHRRFHSSRGYDCNDVEECTRQIVNNAQMCIISTPRISQYLASEMGIQKSSKFLCTLQEDLFTVGFIFLLNNDSPFLNKLNVLTRRTLEGGLLDRYWEQLLYITSLRSKMTVDDGKEDLYFVFSLSHLSPAFCALGFGYGLSSAVFLSEIFVKWVTKGRK
jgi:hypothetical protein